MALIKCSDCGKSISEHASVCPNCGCPLEFSKKNVVGVVDESEIVAPTLNDTPVVEEKKKSKKGIIIAVITVFVLVIGVVGLFLLKVINLHDIKCAIFGCTSPLPEVSCNGVILIDENKDYLQVITEYINVRSDSYRGSSKVAQVCLDEKYNVVDVYNYNDETWYKIMYQDNQYGWIISEYNGVSYVQFYDKDDTTTTTKNVSSDKKTTTKKKTTTAVGSTPKSTTKTTTKATTTKKTTTKKSISASLSGKDSVYSEYGTSCKIDSASISTSYNETTDKVEITLNYTLTMTRQTSDWKWCKFDVKVYDSDGVQVKKGIMYEEVDLNGKTAGRTYLNFESNDTNFKVQIVPYK